MTLQNAIQKRTGNFPQRGQVGVERADWLPVGEIDVSTGELCVVDAMMLNRDDGIVQRVPPGRYVVQGKVIDFDGHLRVSRLRVALEGAVPRLGGELGEVGTDSATMAACDIGAIDEGMDDDANEELADKLFEVECEGGAVVHVLLSHRTVEFAVCESGLGDGGYPVFGLEEGGRVIGLEVEFLPPGYRME